MDAPAFDANSLPTERATPDRLPALIDRARGRLAEARTSAEVLEAKHVAEAALHYAKVTGAANEAHADCLRIITRCEIRISREVDAAQQRGEVARAGDNPNVRAADNQSTIADLGIDRRRLAEWRDLAEAGEDAVDEAIDEAVDDAREKRRRVTKADVHRKVSARQEYAPAVSPRPDHLNHLALLIRNMAGVIPKFMDHREAMSLASRYGVQFDPEQVETIMSFTAALLTGLKADRAA